MGDKNQGLYPEGKFIVNRIDGTDQKSGDKHFGCDYFVLDITHDKHAIPALKTYAESSRKDGYEMLANDIEAKLEALNIKEFPEHSKLQKRKAEIFCLTSFFDWCSKKGIAILHVDSLKKISSDELLSSFFGVNPNEFNQEVLKILNEVGGNNDVNG